VLSLLAATCVRCAASTQSNLYQVLEERGIHFDEERVRASVIEGLLKSVDPRARILSAEEAEALGRGNTIEKAEAWPEGIYYLKLRGLYDGGGEEVVQRLGEWTETNRTGVVFDLRGAEGDSLASVDAIAGLIAATNTPLYAVRNVSNEVVDVHHAAEGGPARFTVPLVLLVDGETSDASEVLAAALKDCRGVLLIGAPTRGDAALRELIPLSETEVLYVATRRVVPARGREYDEVGVEPDIALPAAETKGATAPPLRTRRRRPLSEKAERDAELIRRVADDGALSRAADVLFGLKALDVRPRPCVTADDPVDGEPVLPADEPPPLE